MIAIAEARERRQLDGELERPADHRRGGQPDQRPWPEMRIDPVTENHSADDGADVEEARRHGRHAEDVFGIEHSHHERGERNQENERKHDPGELDRQRGFRRIETRCEQIHQLNREHHSGDAQRAEHHGGQSGDFVCEQPRPIVSAARDGLAECGDECCR